MKKIIFTVSVSLLTLFFSSTNIFACSLMVGEPTRLNPSDYIFVGKVIGYTEETKPNLSEDRIKGIKRKYTNEEKSAKIIESIEKNLTSAAIIVELDTPIHLPEKSAKYFEVYPLNMYGPCYYSGRSKTKLEEVFPINSKVNVIAQKSTLFGNTEKTDRLELITQTYQQLSLTKSLGNEFDSSLNAETDYKSLFEPRKYINGKVLKFELQKEFVRMEFGNKETRIKTLERLVYFPLNIYFYQIAKNYLEETDSNFQKLINLRNKFEKENFK